jgi:TPR repeat protein
MTQRRFGLSALAAGVLLVWAGAAAAQDFADGMRAHLAKHYAESRRVFLALADDGDVRSQFMMGTIYEQGLGVPKDLAAAARWYRRAADGGNASAQYNLGIFYQFGKGVPKDAKEAVRWLLKAADQGHGRAQNNLSTFYFTGVGVKRDPVEAWKWLTLSADDLKGAGRDIALENRKIIERDMTPAEIADAHKRVADWQARHGK